jgi:NitT/TauT family transport system ATP-binding protein
MTDDVRIEHLSFSYGKTPLFRDFSLVLGKENPLAILGPSGCGKTTLLRLIAGLLQPDSGEIRFSAQQNTGASGCSIVFQEPRLFPWLPALENVALPLKQRIGSDAAKERAERFLHLVGLEKRLTAYPAELSGGEKQRVSIARAFAFPASLILMDEPFQSLDIPRRIEMMDLCLSLLNENQGAPPLLIAVTHDPGEAVYLGRRIIALGQMPGQSQACSIVFDETPGLEANERSYGSAKRAALEKGLIEALSGPLDKSDRGTIH